MHRMHIKIHISHIIANVLEIYISGGFSMDFLYLVLEKYPLCTCIVLFLLGMIIGLLLSPLETWFHEFGHYIAIIIKKKDIEEFKDELKSEILLKNNRYFFTSGLTKSNFLKFLSDNQPNYIDCIKYIARAGVLFSSVFYLIAIITFCVMSIFVSVFFLIGCGIAIFFLLRSLLSYYISHKEYSDKNIVRHPEKYKYLY